jgi:hypothetical protein
LFKRQATKDSAFWDEEKNKMGISFPLFNGSDVVVRRRILIHQGGGQAISSFSLMPGMAWHRGRVKQAWQRIYLALEASEQ